MEIDFDKFLWKEIENGASKYDFIMKTFNNTNVSKDEIFQKAFTGFYRVRRSKEKFLKKYYSYMETLKGKTPTYKEIITTISTFIGTIEPSFSSKLLATLNPNMPVWDMYVLNNIGLSMPYGKKTIDKCVDNYKKICEWYKSFLATEKASIFILEFDKRLPQFSHFTRTKKIDLMLWQARMFEVDNYPMNGKDILYEDNN